MYPTVDRRNPAPVDVAEEKYFYIYRVLYIPGGDRRISSINKTNIEPENQPFETENHLTQTSMTWGFSR